MKITNLCFSAVLTCMVAMFISSCVQGDLCDEFYDEDMNWWYSHKKKRKGYWWQLSKRFDSCQIICK